MDDFAELLGELDTLAKALPPTDDGKGGKDKDGDGKEGAEKIAAAATDGEEASEGGDDDETFGKSFDVTLADGTVQKAFDGTTMMKALHAQVTNYGATLGKALTATVAGLKAANTRAVAQDALIKSLQDQVTKLGGQGSGRRAVVTLHDKQAGAAAAPGAGDGEGKLNKGDLLNKSLALQAEGKMTGMDVSRLQANLDRGILPPDLARLLGVAVAA